MTYAVRNLTIQDPTGKLLAGATVTVRRALQGEPLAPIYEDREGTTLHENPFVTLDGKATFFAPGGAYLIEVEKGDYEDTLPYVAIGRGAETDLEVVEWIGVWSNVANYGKGNGVTHTGSAGLRSFISLVEGNLNHAPDANTPGSTEFWLLSPGVTTEQANAILAGATAQAGVATTQATTATTQAGIATTKATEAAASALSAAASSVSPALRYAFDAGTSGVGLAAGEFRGNNATLGSWTKMFVADNAIQGDMATFLNAVFNGTSPTKGRIFGVHPLDETKMVLFKVTGVTDQTGYVEFDGSIEASSGPFTADWQFVFDFKPTGDQGAGDMTSTANLSDVANKRAAKDNISIHGSDIVAASTIDLESATGDFLKVTGNTGIATITLGEGHERTVLFTGTPILTSSANLVLKGTDITIVANTWAVFRGDAGSVTRLVSIHPPAEIAGTLAQIKAKTPGKLVTADGLFSPLAPVAITSGATPGVNIALGRKFTLQFDVNFTLALPTNCAVGDEYVIHFTEGTGSGVTAAFAPGHKGSDGVMPIVNTGAAQRTRLHFEVTAVSGTTATEVLVSYTGGLWA